MKLIRKVKNLLVRILNKLKRETVKFIYKKEIGKLINKINSENKKTMIFFNVVDWNIPLFQRPQHIARYIAKEGFNYIYFTGNYYDNIKTYEEVDDGLYIVNACYISEFLKKLKVDNKFLHLYSTDMNTDNKRINKFLKKDFKLLYEYIDEISEQLYGSNIPEHTLQKHKRLLEDHQVYIVCTARKLYNEVFNIRGNERLQLITNGVDYKHFSRRVEENVIPEIVKKGKTIIGYFGALASWFDYELVGYLAEQKPEYEILLIGWDYDGSVKKSGLEKYENVSIIGPIQYNDLPKYAQWFDVATIPFKINSITESTSPIKLFEYMALAKPIVTTAMPECKLYKSVLIANNKEEFIENIEKAINLSNDKEYQATLEKEAKQNTWQAKAKEIVKMLEDE